MQFVVICVMMYFAPGNEGKPLASKHMVGERDSPGDEEPQIAAEGVCFVTQTAV